MKKIFVTAGTILIAIASFLFLYPSPASANKLAIGLGHNLGDVQTAADLVGPGGWLVMAGAPEDCSSFLSVPANVNIVIRADNGGCAFSQDHARAWAATLATMVSRMGAGDRRRLYFIPWNEPSHAEETVGSPIASVPEYIDTLIKSLETFGLRIPGGGANKVALLSPGLDPHFPIQVFGNEAFLSQFDGIAVKGYTIPGTQPRDYLKWAAERLGLSQPWTSYQFYIPGGGSILHTYEANGPKPMFEDEHVAKIVDDFTNAAPVNLHMYAVLSYDPHYGEAENPDEITGYPNWDIFNSEQTAAVYEAKNTPTVSPYTADTDTFYNSNTVSTMLEFISREEGWVTCNSCSIAPTLETCQTDFCRVDTYNKSCRIVGSATNNMCAEFSASQTQDQESIDPDHPVATASDGLYNFLNTTNLGAHLRACAKSKNYDPNNECRNCSNDDCRNGLYKSKKCKNSLIVITNPENPGDRCLRESYTICKANCDDTIVSAARVDEQYLPEEATTGGCCSANNPECSTPDTGWVQRIFAAHSDEVFNTYNQETSPLKAFVDKLGHAVTNITDLLNSGESLRDILSNINPQIFFDWDTKRESTEEAPATGGMTSGEFSFNSISHFQTYGGCFNCDTKEMEEDDYNWENFLAHDGQPAKYKMYPGAKWKLRPPYDLSKEDPYQDLYQTTLASEASSTPVSDKGTQLAQQGETFQTLRYGIIGLGAAKKGLESIFDSLIRVPTASFDRELAQALRGEPASTALAQLSPSKQQTPTANLLIPESKTKPITRLAQASLGGTIEDNYIYLQGGGEQLRFSLTGDFDLVSVVVLDSANGNSAHFTLQPSDFVNGRYHCCDGEHKNYAECSGVGECPQSFKQWAAGMHNLCATGSYEGHYYGVMIDVFSGTGGPVNSIYAGPFSNSDSPFAGCWDKMYFFGRKNESDCGDKALRDPHPYEICTPVTSTFHHGTINEPGEEDVSIDAPGMDLYSLLENTTSTVKESLVEGTGTTGFDIDPETNEKDCDTGLVFKTEPEVETVVNWSCHWNAITSENTWDPWLRAPSETEDINRLLGGIDNNNHTDVVYDKTVPGAMTPPSIDTTGGKWFAAKQKYTTGWTGLGTREGADPRFQEAALGDEVKYDNGPGGRSVANTLFINMSGKAPNKVYLVRRKFDEINPEYRANQLIAVKPTYKYLAQRSREHAERLAKAMRENDRNSYPKWVRGLGSILASLY